MSRAARSRPSTRAVRSEPSGANGSSTTRPLSSCHVPATKPSTRIVACTIAVVRDDARRRNVAQDSRPVGVREHEVVEARNQPHGSRRLGVRQRRPREVESVRPCSSWNVRSDCRSSEARDRREARDARPIARRPASSPARRRRGSCGRAGRTPLPAPAARPRASPRRPCTRPGRRSPRSPTAGRARRRPVPGCGAR